MQCMHAQIERHLQHAYSAASYTSARPFVLDRIVHGPSSTAWQTRSSIHPILYMAWRPLSSRCSDMRGSNERAEVNNQRFGTPASHSLVHV
jgi:hypothetical protein